jgi:hypothetical protein
MNSNETHNTHDKNAATGLHPDTHSLLVMTTNTEALSPGQSVLYQDFNKRNRTAWVNTYSC